VKGIAIWLALAAAATALFLLFPGVDLWTSGLFYRPGEGFFLKDWAVVRAVYVAVPYLTQGILVLVLVALLWWLLRGRPLFGLERRKMAFLVLALALGPGLLVNTVLKDHWGRARPSQIVEFGGERHFTPAPLPAGECERNCSFVGGHAAMGFYLVAFAFLTPAPHPRRVVAAAAVVAGALAGLVRIAQGGHFLSDIVFAGLVVWAVTWLLHLWVVEHDGLTSPPMRRLYAGVARLPGMTAAIAARRGGLLGLWSAATGAAVALSILYVDRPLTIWFHERDADLHALFAFITKFGVSTGYLILTALLFLGLRLAARDPRLAAWRERLVAWSYLPGFVFVSMAASGLTADLVKLLIGRSRPKLLFLPGEMYSFGFFATQADQWSFPSGHMANATALATALYFLWPRHVAACAIFALLIGASRVVLSAHYMSDVIGGAFIAVLVTLYVHRVFARSGIDLDLAKQGRLGPPVRASWRVRLGFGRAKPAPPPGAATDSP
jgi:lipid A 4'-phosphatase